jgi:hypothetical protein
MNLESLHIMPATTGLFLKIECQSKKQALHRKAKQEYERESLYPKPKRYHEMTNQVT